MTQRTWLITGVNSGFGRLMTEALLERGDRVAGTVRKLDAMNELKAKYGDRLWLANLDMTNLPAVRGVVEKAFAELGTIDVIVSNAGYGLFGAAEELSDEQVAISSPQISSGRSSLYARHCLICARKAADGSSACLPTAGRRRFRVARSTMRASGGSKVSWIQSPRNSLRSR